jgi:hypothetical protein
MEHQKQEIQKNRHKMAGGEKGLSRSAHPSSLIKKNNVI